MDEKWNRWTKKRMKETCSQPKIMCQSKLYLFTTKRYVLIETPPIHLQEVCVSQNINSSSRRNICQSKHHLFFSKRYVPIRNWNNMRLHILYTHFNLVFKFKFSFLDLLCLGPFLLLEKSNYIFSPSSLELPSSIFSTTTTHL
jgi:hypothetical protein